MKSKSVKLYIKAFVLYESMITSNLNNTMNSFSRKNSKLYETPVKRPSSPLYESAEQVSSHSSQSDEEADYITIAPDSSPVSTESGYVLYVNSTSKKKGSQKSTNSAYSSIPGSRTGSRKKSIRRTSTKK